MNPNYSEPAPPRRKGVARTILVSVLIPLIILAAGVLSFRAFDLFANSKTEPVGSSLEREITYLLEPITGQGDVRVSVSGRTDRQILVMMNGAVGEDLRALRTQVESVLGASLGYNPETDTLTLTQFPFARGVGSSFTLFQIAEFTGLSLLTILLLLIYTAPARTVTVPRAGPSIAITCWARLRPAFSIICTRVIP